MRVAELRDRLAEKVAQAASEADEELVARALTYVRVILVALAGRPGAEDVSLDKLTVGTQTAAVIMGLPEQFVRSLVRDGRLSSAKTNDEFRLSLSAIAEHMLMEEIRKKEALSWIVRGQKTPQHRESPPEWIALT